MESSEDEDDPVVREMDVYLSQSEHLFLLHYPLHPSSIPYTSERIAGVRVSGGGTEGVELDVKVRPRGENYSTSRGEHYASMATLGSKSSSGGSSVYSSELFDRVTLSSSSSPLKNHRYAVATIRGTSLHLTPLQGVAQLRPSLSYLDQADMGAKKLEVASDECGDTTESEGEEAKPVTVKFAKRENVAKSKQKKVGRKKLFTEATENAKSARSWTEVMYHGVESEEAEEERRLLFMTGEDQMVDFGGSYESYLDQIFPSGGSGESEAGGEGGGSVGNGNGASNGSGGAISIEQIRKLPLKKQVVEVLRSSHMIQFGQLCSLLGMSGGKMGCVLEAVIGCSVLVQGCWVVDSQVVYPDPGDTAKRNARDYILWQFSKERFVHRKDVMGVVKLPNEEVRQLMQSLAVQKFIPHQGWEFKLDTDLDFIARNSSVVLKEEEKWSKRWKQLQAEVNMKSPGSTKAGSSTLVTPPAAGGSAGAGGSEGKGHRRSRSKGGRKDSETAAVEPETKARKNSGSVAREEKGLSKEKSAERGSIPEPNDDTVTSSLPLTPTRHRPSASALAPQAISMTTVGNVAMETNPMDTSDPFPAEAPFLGASDLPMELEKEVAVDSCGLSVPLEAQSLEMVSQASALTSNTLNSDLDEPLLHQRSPESTIASRVVPLTSIPSSPPDILIKQEQPDSQEVSVKQESSGAAPFIKKEPAVEQKRPPPPPAPAQREEPLTDAVADFCKDALGRGVIGLGDLKDKLLLKQISVGAGHPLQQGVSDAVLEGALGLLGAVEVGQPLGKRLFALPHDGVCRSVILEMCQKHKFIKKKLVVDELLSRGHNLSEKEVAKSLKELCYGRGGHWRLLGT